MKSTFLFSAFTLSLALTAQTSTTRAEEARRSDKEIPLPIASAPAKKPEAKSGTESVLNVTYAPGDTKTKFSLDGVDYPNLEDMLPVLERRKAAGNYHVLIRGNKKLPAIEIQRTMTVLANAGLDNIAFSALNTDTAPNAGKPLLAIPGKVIYETTFASGVDAKWKTAKGKWEAAGRVLHGAEKAEDNHPGVTRAALTQQDFIIEYEVNLDGAKQTTLSVNGAKDHMARILIGPTFVQVQKDDSDHEGPDRAVVFARMAADIKPGTWHKVRMELVGDTMLGKVDDLVAFGSNNLFKNPKGNFGFTVAGESVEVRNLKVWEATKNPEWDNVKDTLPKATPAAAAKGPGKKKEKAAQ